jgi:hypothetical protein
MWSLTGTSLCKSYLPFTNSTIFSVYDYLKTICINVSVKQNFSISRQNVDFETSEMNEAFFEVARKNYIDSYDYVRGVFENQSVAYNASSSKLNEPM